MKCTVSTRDVTMMVMVLVLVMLLHMRQLVVNCLFFLLL